MTFVRMTILAGATLLAATGASAHGPEKLGKVNFPTSCAPAVQPEFERAVALLHSFWFQPAIKGFATVAQTDPSCGIAHWGAAVAWLGNPLAGPPVARGLAEGSAAVARAKAAGAKTPRDHSHQYSFPGDDGTAKVPNLRDADVDRVHRWNIRHACAG